MNEISAVIFDLDGVLIDSERVARTAWQQAMLEYGYILTNDIYCELIGRRPFDVDAILRLRYGSAMPLYDIRLRKRCIWEDAVMRNGIPVKEGVKEVLDYVDALRFPFAIATSSNSLDAMEKLKQSMLLCRFSIIVCGDQVPNGKPEPDIYLEAAERLKTPPSKCLAFEDSEAGFLAAKTAGMATMLIPDLVDWTVLRKPDANGILASMIDAPLAIKGLL